MLSNRNPSRTDEDGVAYVDCYSTVTCGVYAGTCASVKPANLGGGS